MSLAKQIAATALLVGLVYWLSPLRFGQSASGHGCGRDQIGCLIAATDPDERDPVTTGSVPRGARANAPKRASVSH